MQFFVKCTWKYDSRTKLQSLVLFYYRVLPDFAHYGVSRNCASRKGQIGHFRIYNTRFECDAKIFLAKKSAERAAFTKWHWVNYVPRWIANMIGFCFIFKVLRKIRIRRSVFICVFSVFVLRICHSNIVNLLFPTNSKRRVCGSTTKLPHQSYVLYLLFLYKKISC